MSSSQLTSIFFRGVEATNQIFIEELGFVVISIIVRLEFRARVGIAFSSVQLFVQL